MKLSKQIWAKRSNNKFRKYAKLVDLVQIIKSIELGNKVYENNGIVFIQVSNLSPFGLRSNEIYLNSKDFKKMNYKLYI